jgi:DNA invertase Pin-like site-specific DNA recombinase
MTTNCAVLLRVSTDEQDSDNQVPDVERLVAQRGYRETKRYTISDSAFDPGAEYRAVLAQVLADAHAGHFSILVVWAADRLSREGIEDLLRIVRQLRERGVVLVSVQEPWLSGSDETTDLLIAISAWVANQESKRRSARIRAGLARRRAAGLPMGGRQEGAKDRRPRRTDGYRARYAAR